MIRKENLNPYYFFDMEAEIFIFCLFVYAEFYKEVIATMKRAAAEKIGAENIILEVNSLK